MARATELKRRKSLPITHFSHYVASNNLSEVDMEKRVDVLGIAGSLRKESYNRGLLRAAAELAPALCTLEVFDLIDIPIYNQDEETDPPKSVIEFKKKIRAADAILIATPEYNYSMPGVLKKTLSIGHPVLMETAPGTASLWQSWEPLLRCRAPPAPNTTSVRSLSTSTCAH